MINKDNDKGILVNIRDFDIFLNLNNNHKSLLEFKDFYNDDRKVIVFFKYIDFFKEIIWSYCISNELKNIEKTKNNKCSNCFISCDIEHFQSRKLKFERLLKINSE